MKHVQIVQNGTILFESKPLTDSMAEKIEFLLVGLFNKSDLKCIVEPAEELSTFIEQNCTNQSPQDSVLSALIGQEVVVDLKTGVELFDVRINNAFVPAIPTHTVKHRFEHVTEKIEGEKLFFLYKDLAFHKSVSFEEAVNVFNDCTGQIESLNIGEMVEQVCHANINCLRQMILRVE